MNLDNTEGRLLTVQEVRNYMLAGKATFTLRSAITQTRYTYKVQRTEHNLGEARSYFVGLLSGPDNNVNYAYMGMLRAVPDGKLQFQLTRKSKMRSDSPPVVALCFLLRCVQTDTISGKLEVWHAGRCGRCGRKLTVPESVRSGLGPECAEMAA